MVTALHHAGTGRPASVGPAARVSPKKLPPGFVVTVPQGTQQPQLQQGVQVSSLSGLEVAGGAAPSRIPQPLEVTGGSASSRSAQHAGVLQQSPARSTLRLHSPGRGPRAVWLPQASGATPQAEVLSGRSQTVQPLRPSASEASVGAASAPSTWRSNAGTWHPRHQAALHATPSSPSLQTLPMTGRSQSPQRHVSVHRPCSPQLTRSTRAVSPQTLARPSPSPPSTGQRTTLALKSVRGASSAPDKATGHSQKQSSLLQDTGINSSSTSLLRPEHEASELGSNATTQATSQMTGRASSHASSQQPTLQGSVSSLQASVSCGSTPTSSQANGCHDVMARVPQPCKGPETLGTFHSRHASSSSTQPGSGATPALKPNEPRSTDGAHAASAAHAAPRAQSCASSPPSCRKSVSEDPAHLSEQADSNPAYPARLSEQADSTAAFARLQELTLDPPRCAPVLREFFIAADGTRTGLIQRDDAVWVLDSTFSTHLADLPATSIDEAKWRSLLKRFGVYAVDDTVDYATLIELYLQTLWTLRDCFAPWELLRGQRRVPRGGPRLQDFYDSFEFKMKDSLGKVYSCRDSRTHEARTCRQVRKDKASAPIDLIRRSLMRMRELVNSHVPRVYEFLEDFHNFYIIFAPARGGELLDHIQDSFMQKRVHTEAWVAGVVRQVLEAMAYCHAQPLGPVIHRDLKPENILLSNVTVQDGHVALPHVSVTNFGLQLLFDLFDLGCPPLSMSTDSLPVCCVPEYLAPEIWRQDFGPRCDVWACGCLLFLLLTGCLPFSPRMALKDLVRLISSGEPDWRLFRHVSTSALSLCRRMLSRSDIVRPTAAECLRHPWFGNPGGDDRVTTELQPEIVGSLMQSYAQAKCQQVLMNVVAAELRVSKLRQVWGVISRLDTENSGSLSFRDFEAALTELGVSQETISQVSQSFLADRSGKVSYGPFMAGCVDLVDDKLDHMLWKVFSMVDEDHSGEVGTVELEHFLARVCDSAPQGGGQAASTPSGISDVERYLRGILEPNVHAAEAVMCIANGRDVVTFEDVKRFVLDTGGAAPSNAKQSL